MSLIGRRGKGIKKNYGRTFKKKKIGSVGACILALIPYIA